ncbi:secretin N-terminal domain-containing protein [Pseudomonas sp. zfem003]|uniref:secretin N-terminal domain-containing protein n=1 Tax=Pseudomonas sp. zfem003 TaxID=3078198 RepID=UPI0029292291|nr:secretin N-terminal domain-containing protein [Pseudomonas sp. zfem003]MDU9398709.1 secretin N-terminal domain-containing protein [Pseudomonas sp. zfem003]
MSANISIFRNFALNCYSLVLIFVALAGCGSALPESNPDVDRLVREGRNEDALALLKEKYRSNPRSEVYKGALVRLTDLTLNELTAQGERARSDGDFERASDLYRRALLIDPGYERAKSGQKSIEQSRRQQGLLTGAEKYFDTQNFALASDYLGQILSENPTNANALALQARIREKRYQQEGRVSLLDKRLDRTVSLELRDTPLKDALLLISNSAGLNFIIDQDIPADKKVTLFVTDARIMDVLEFILQTYSLEKKVLNRNTILLFLDSPEKRGRYSDLYTRSFRIANSTPSAVAEMLRGILKPADLYVDERARSLIIRDTPEVLEAAERLISLHDIAPPEVIFDVEIIEVSTDALSNLGIEYPNRISLSVQGEDKKAGTLRWSELKNLNSDSFMVGVGDPLAVINMKNTLGSANILAKPQIRVRNREKANILIGDKVPVITSTLNQTSGFESQSVTYLDVGIKLDVEPEIYPGNEVAMKVMLEVSNIAKEIVGDNGLRAYQIGTRTANTTLQLKDGETQILAGLIKNEGINSESRVPGLGSLPWLGRMFSSENNNQKKSELVLLITPRIVRNTSYPNAFDSEFYSGTKDRLSLSQPALGESGYQTERPAPLTSQPQGQVVKELPTPSLSHTAVQVNPRGAEVIAQLDMAIPQSVTAGQEFNIPLTLDGGFTGPLTFELRSDSPAFEVVSVTQILPEPELSHAVRRGSILFDLERRSAPRANDVLAVARVRAKAGSSEGAMDIRLEPETAPGVAPRVQGQARTIMLTAPLDDGGMAGAIDSIMP